MKLPSRLARSRHGIFYFRLQFQIESKRKERRISLQTKSPFIAKAKAIHISAMMLGYNHLDADMPPFDPNDPNALAKLLKGNHQKFDFELPGGAKISCEGKRLLTGRRFPDYLYSLDLHSAIADSSCAMV